MIDAVLRCRCPDRNVGLRLVVVVIGDEVLNGVLRKNSLSSCRLCRQGFVVGQHQCGSAGLGDDVGHRERLAGARRPQQRLIALAAVHPRHQLLDRRRLITLQWAPGREVVGGHGCCGAKRRPSIIAGNKMKCCGSPTRDPDRLVHHAPGALGLRWLGLGRICARAGRCQLQRLFDRHAFWAHGRGFAQLRRLLAGSDAVVSLARQAAGGLRPGHLDGFSRAVLWDIVVAGDLQGHGLGRRVIEELLHTPPVVGVEQTVSDDHQECRLPGNWASRMRIPSS